MGFSWWLARVLSRFRADPGFGHPAVAQILEALGSEDWRGACDLFARLPFDQRSVVLDGVADRLDHPSSLELWVVSRADSHVPLLFKGVALTYRAWRIRGAFMAEDVAENAWQGFHENLGLAWQTLAEAAERAPDDPEPWARMIRVGMGLGLEKEALWETFSRLEALAPEHLIGCLFMLDALAQKWVGTHEDMFAFARKKFEDAVSGSSLPALVAMAHIEFWVYNRNWPDGDRERMPGYFLEEDVAREIEMAYQLSFTGYRDSFSPYAHNIFAFGLFRSGNPQLARTALSKIGKQVTKRPWNYAYRNEAAIYNYFRGKSGLFYVL